MDNKFHVGFAQWLVLGWGLVVGYWMSRAPKSVLALFGLGTEIGHAWLVKSVRGLGRFMFFCLLFSMLSVGSPAQFDKIPGYSLITLAIAIGASVFLLRKRTQSTS